MRVVLAVPAHPGGAEPSEDHPVVPSQLQAAEVVAPVAVEVHSVLPVVLRHVTTQELDG